mgnify:CR=1 FL=1
MAPFHGPGPLRVKADVTLGELDKVKHGDWVTAGGIIAATRQLRTRTGSQMMFVTLDDLEGTIRAAEHRE